MPTLIIPDQVDLSYLDALGEWELERERQIVKARKYHDGDHPTFLTPRLKQFLNAKDDDTFRLNVTRAVVESLAERLLVKGFGSVERAVSDWAWNVWLDNRMDANQYDVYEAAIRDGEHFVIIHWDNSLARVRFSSNPRYTSTAAEGDGDGVIMYYPDDNDQQPAEYAIKRWSEWAKVDGKSTLRRRATVYYPERIERFVYTKDWSKFTEPNMPWPQPWIDSAGAPLGLPVVHFKNPSLRPEATDAWPIQDGINKTNIDLLAASDAAGQPVYSAMGFQPTTDGKPLADDKSNALILKPGIIIGTVKSKQDASFDLVPAANVDGLMDVTQQQLLWLAVATRTPPGRFQSTRQVASSDTLKQQEEPLIAKAELRQARFGNSWEMCFGVARKLQNTFGNGSLNEDAAIETLWRPAAKRSEKETQDELTFKKSMGIPTETIWIEMGYSPEQVESMKASPEYQAQLALVQAGLGLVAGGQ